jgi:transketolase
MDPVLQTKLVQAGNMLRRDVVEMVYRTGDGHPGPCMSAADMVAVLYFHVLHIDPLRPDWEDRDRFILSKGHACPVLYAALARRGYFPHEELFTLRMLGSRLQGHPVAGKLPGIDATAGSLGNGVSIGLGMAMAGRMQRRNYHVYVMCGDGELSEGLIWEAAMAAGHLGAANLTVIVDNNGYQSGGTVGQISGVDPIDKKWEAFGWKAIGADGNDPSSFLSALNEASSETQRPQAIIAKTVKGRGISYMIGDNSWHKRLFNDEEYRTAMSELAGPDITVQEGP